MVQYKSDAAQQPVARFLAMPVCNVSTAEALFDALAQELQSRDMHPILLELWLGHTILY